MTNLSKLLFVIFLLIAFKAEAENATNEKSINHKYAASWALSCSSLRWFIGSLDLGEEGGKNNAAAAMVYDQVFAAHHHTEFNEVLTNKEVRQYKDKKIIKLAELHKKNPAAVTHRYLICRDWATKSIYPALANASQSSQTEKTPDSLRALLAAVPGPKSEYGKNKSESVLKETRQLIDSAIKAWEDFGGFTQSEMIKQLKDALERRSQ